MAKVRFFVVVAYVVKLSTIPSVPCYRGLVVVCGVFCFTRWLRASAVGWNDNFLKPHFYTQAPRA